MTEDRRRFFRINDTVGVSYRVLTEDDLNNPANSSPDSLDAVGLITGYDGRIEALLSELRAVQPLVADLMDAFNHKLNGVVAQLQLDSDLVQRIAHKVQEVNISACGMAFATDETLPNGTLLAMDILLLPNNVHILTRAGVVGSAPASTGNGHHLRVEFIDMESHDQETLIQHIVRRQVTLIRAMRQNEQRGEV